MLKEENGITNGTDKGTQNHQKTIKDNREKRLENRHLGGEAKDGKRTKKPRSPGKTGLKLLTRYSHTNLLE